MAVLMEMSEIIRRPGLIINRTGPWAGRIPFCREYQAGALASLKSALENFLSLPPDFTVLAAEDDEGHQLLLARAFRRANLPVKLQFVQNGSEAISYLRGEGQYNDRARFPFPHLFFSDVNMPGTSGFEVLDRIKRGSPLEVLMLTSSPDPKDVNTAWDLGASAYLVKPLKFAEWTEL
jgi:CheY-like chemotaxis protein